VGGHATHLGRELVGGKERVSEIFMWAGGGELLKESTTRKKKRVLIGNTAHEKVFGSWLSSAGK